MNKKNALLIVCGLAFAGCELGAPGSSSTVSNASGPTLSFSTKGKRSYASAPAILVDGDFVIHADGVTAARGYSDARSNLYYATFSNPDVLIELSSYGKVEYKDKERMVLRIDDDEDIALASALLHEKGGSKCGGLRNVPLTPVSDVREGDGFGLVDPAEIKKSAAVETITAKVDKARIRASIEKLVGFGSRYHASSTGQQASDWVADGGYRAAANGREDVTIERFQHQRTTQKSIITRIRGAKEPSKIVIVGSHLDSINGRGSNVAPGADDNASGTSTALEAFRALMESGAKFDYTVEFHAYAAEEMGLWGSSDVAARYKADGKDVVAMVQLDMTGYVGSSEKKLWLVSNGTSQPLNAALAKLIDLYVGVPHGSAPLTAGTSDHASWTRNGFKASFPFENPSSDNPHIHTENDTLDKLDMDFAALFGKLAVAYVSHFAGLQAGGGGGGGGGGAQVSTDLFMRIDDADLLRLSAPAAVQRMALCQGGFDACRATPQIALDFAADGDRAGRRFFKASRALTLEDGLRLTMLAYDSAGALAWAREVALGRN